MQSGKILSLAQSLRLSSTFLPWILCCSVLLTYSENNAYIYLLSSLLLAVSYGFVTIYNDLSDSEIDIRNQRKDIPFANGEVSRENLRDLLIGLLIIGWLVALFLNVSTLLWLSVYFFLGWLYSGPLDFKGRGLLAVSILGICYGVMPWLLGYSILAQPPTSWAYIIMFASFIFAAGIISLKDFKDVKGDTFYGKRTLLVRYGGRVTHKIIVVSTCVSYLFIAGATYALAHSITLTCISVVLLLLNFALLSTKNIRLKSHIRRRNGHLSRTLFFLYAAVLSLY